MIYNVWEILGIAPTSDKKEIKKAYARQSALFHPEEHPEEFNRLYNAYKTALKIAGTGQITQDTADQPAAKADETQESPKPQEPHAHQEFPKAQGPHAHQEFPETQESHAHQKSQETQGPYEPPSSFPSSESSQAQTKAIHPSQEIPSISQLVEEGAAKETEAAAGKLMEKLKALHASFPKSVNTNKTELNKALDRLDLLFDSQWFDMAGWEPVFLNQLDHWLAENRDHINRAETVALFKAYRFQQFGSPSYPTVPYLSNIHWEVMQQALRFQKEMVALAGMKPQTSSPSRSRTREQSRRHSFLPFLVVIITFFIFKIAASVPSSPDKPKNIDEYRQKIMANASIQASQWENIKVLETKPPAMPDNPIPSPASPKNWVYDGYGPIKRPDNTPVRPDEYEYYGKNQLTMAYKGSSILKSNEWTPTDPTALIFTCQNAWGMHAIDSFLLDPDRTASDTVYDLETISEPPIPFQIWLEPLDTEDGDENAFCIAGCGYWSELFLHYASQAGVEGRSWYDEDHNAHLVLKWDSVQTADELIRRLSDAYSQYYAYVGGLTPSMNLTILYGPDTDQALDALQALEKPQEDGLSYVTISEEEQLARCPASPKPSPSASGAPAPLSEYDGSLRWISRIHLERNEQKNLEPKETLSQLTKDLESLDWALARYELKSGETPQDESMSEDSSPQSGTHSRRKAISTHALMY